MVTWAKLVIAHCGYLCELTILHVKIKLKKEMESK